MVSNILVKGSSSIAYQCSISFFICSSSNLSCNLVVLKSKMGCQRLTYIRLLRLFYLIVLLLFFFFFFRFHCILGQRWCPIVLQIFTDKVDSLQIILSPFLFVSISNVLYSNSIISENCYSKFTFLNKGCIRRKM